MPTLVRIDGRVVACPNTSIPHSWHRAWIVKDEMVVVVDSNANENQVLLYDMGKCTIEQILYRGSSSEAIFEAMVSRDNLMAIWRSYDQKREVIIVNAEGFVVCSIPEAERPVWSNDGLSIAYTNITTGIWIADVNCAHPKRIASDGYFRGSGNSYIDWSPDDRWIVF